jgi:GNAT superfamily N-acetyltransferase
MGEPYAQYEIIEFDAPTAPPELWRLYHAFRRLRHAEMSPEDPLLPDDLTEASMKRVDPYEAVQRFAAVQDGRMVGLLYTDWWQPAAPGYERNAKYLWAFGEVTAPARRHGIGTALARQALAVMNAQDKSLATVWCRDEADGYAFLAWLGAAQVSTGAENRLDLRAVDWDMVADWVRQGEARNPRARLALYEQRIPDDALAVFCPAFAALLNTMPFDDMDMGEIVVTPDLMREQYRWMDDVGASHHAYVAYEPDGSIAGMTDIMYLETQPDRIDQRFTGVRPDCRGRGLGKWVKAAMLQYIRRTYPEARWMITGNANSNEPMLAINRQLGFKPHRGRRTYQITRDELAARLAAL